MTSRPAWRGVMPRVWRCLALSQLLVAGMGVLRAQDQFEIHVLEYEQLEPGEFTFETHMNYVGSGTHTFEGTVAPTQDRLPRYLRVDRRHYELRFLRGHAIEREAARLRSPGRWMAAGSSFLYSGAMALAD